MFNYRKEGAALPPMVKTVGFRAAVLYDFEQFCEKAHLDFHRNPDAPYVTAEGVKDAVYTYLAELEPAEDSALTLGIDTILGEKPDTIHEKLGAFIHGDAATIKELEELGRERMPVSNELNLDDLTKPETKDAAIQQMTDYFVKNGMDVDAIDNLLSEVKMGAISRAETITKAKREE